MLEEKLVSLGQSDKYPFHMPGHKRALTFPNPYSVDITEIEGFDNLHDAQGILKDAQAQAARLYGSRRAYYLVNGSTCGLLAAISAACPRGSKILVARNCHRAVYHAIYLRELNPVYLYPTDTRCGLQGQISLRETQKLLAQNPDAAALVITSPTYDGVVSDVSAIAEEAHRHGIPLIVDEAHGAHFGFHAAFPENAVRYADAVVMSVHKTLPAFTQTALLHLCSERISEKKVQQFLDIYETSSPSYVLMAGIERALSLVAGDGERLFSQYAARLAAFRESMRSLKTLHVLGREDFTPEEVYALDAGKLLIKTGGSMSGQALLQRLLAHGLQMEMACGDYVTAMTSLMDTDEGFLRLADALKEIDKSARAGVYPLLTPCGIYRRQEAVLPLFEAMDAPAEPVALAVAVGRVSAGFVDLYPPGIPILAPGERINGETADIIARCMHCETLSCVSGNAV